MGYYDQFISAKNMEGIDLTIKEFAIAAGVQVTKNEYEMASDKNEFLKQATLALIKKHLEDSIAMSWIENPDRTGS